MNDVAVELDGIWKIFGDDESAVIETIEKEGLDKAQVLERFDAVVGIADVSFEVERGEIFCVMGLSGSGKSTLVRHINRLIEPSAGSISLFGKDVLAMSEAELWQLRSRRVGMVFQHIALLPHKSVLDNVAYPLKIRGESKLDRWRISQEILSRVGLEGYENRFPSELSGGMQQRVGLARAMASDPDILLMDEPFSALDPLIRRQLQDQFLALSKELTKTTIFITHDLDEAIRLGTRIAIMKDGKIVQIGTPEEIVTDPVDDYVRDFVRDISKLKLVCANSIFQPLSTVSADLSRAPRADVGTDLDGLVELSITTDLPIVITDKEGKDIGIVTKQCLLAGIQGGKA